METHYCDVWIDRQTIFLGKFC